MAKTKNYRISLARWRSTQASSLSISHATWVIVAVAMSAVTVGAVAIPSSPVHQWLTCQIGHVSAISATKAGPTTCVIPSSIGSSGGGSATTSSTTLAAIFEDTSTDTPILAAWNGTAWSTLAPPSGDTVATTANGPELVATFADPTTGTTSNPGVQSGSGAWVSLGTNGPTGALHLAWMGSALYAVAGDGLWAWNGTAWTDLAEPSAWGSTALTALAANAAAKTVVVTSADGIGVYHAGAWSTLAYPSAMTAIGASETALAVSGSGAISLASFGYDASTSSVVAGLYQESAGAWSTLTTPSWSNSSVEIDALAPDGTSLVVGWMGAGVGLWNGTAWANWGDPGGSGGVAALAPIGSGRFAAATQSAGVSTGNGTGWTKLAGGPSVDALSAS